MNFELYLPIISQLLGRDVTPDFQALMRARNAIGSTLNEQGQIYLTKNWKSLVDFMETPEGKDAIKMFLELWAESLTPKIITSPDAPQEQQQTQTQDVSQAPGDPVV